MYFAYDHPSPEVAGQIIDALHGIREANRGKPIYVSALIDGAFDEKFVDKNFKKDFPRISLYEGTALGSFGKLAPFLIQVHESKINSSWLEKLIKASGSYPMWSIIVANCDIQALAKHFGRYIVAKCEDKLKWPVRWADTRVLPQLLKALEPDLISDLMHPIYSWFATSRTGNLMRWDGAKGNERCVPGYEKLPMSGTTFARLMDGAEADMVLSRIYDTQPELLNSRMPSECYRLVERQLKLADKFDIDNTGIRQHFATISLFLREDLTGMSEIQILLAKVRDGADYMCELNALSSSFWEQAGIS